ncbi:MAG: hypothetical protein R3C01_11015 [Planctomycetaceae bacterium]
MTPPPDSPPNLLFRAVIIAGSFFAITVMSMVAATFGNPEAPPNRFFNSYGLLIILVETAILLILIFLAMAIDQRRTAQRLHHEQVRKLEQLAQTSQQPDDIQVDIPQSSNPSNTSS